MKEERILKGSCFYGNEVSDYGKKYGYVDYKTLAQAFDAVLCNDITRLFYCDINNEWNEAEQVNGFVDNSEEIEELQEQIKELQKVYLTEENEARQEEIAEQIEEIEDQVAELENQEGAGGEVFQYFIISRWGAEILQAWTDEIVYYLPYLDIYIWGVAHYGTSWDYVLTNIKIEDDEK